MLISELEDLENIFIKNTLFDINDLRFEILDNKIAEENLDVFVKDENDVNKQVELSYLIYYWVMTFDPKLEEGINKYADYWLNY